MRWLPSQPPQVFKAVSLGLIMVMVVATGYTQCMPLKLSLGKKDGHVNAIELK